MRRGLTLTVLGLCLNLAPIGVSVSWAETLAKAGMQLPAGSRAMAHRETALGTYALPVGVYAAAGIPLRKQEGRILRRTWQLRGDATVLQVLQGMRQQLQDQGYEILFQCTSRQCGGFDFRFGIEVVPAPDMVVSLSDYHFLSATKGDEVTSLLVSRSGNATYIQLIEVAPVEQLPLPAAEPVDLQPEDPRPSSLEAMLHQEGRAVLQGVVFKTGAVTLGAEAMQSLLPLVEILNSQPEARVLIVGHTDTVGGLEDNIALSLRRASIVKDALVESYGVDTAQVLTAGAGFMAPIASNLTATGREANRRVEAVLIGE